MDSLESGTPLFSAGSSNIPKTPLIRPLRLFEPLQACLLSIEPVDEYLQLLPLVLVRKAEVAVVHAVHPLVLVDHSRPPARYRSDSVSSRNMLNKDKKGRTSKQLFNSRLTSLIYFYKINNCFVFIVGDNEANKMKVCYQVLSLP